jgi:hypothetical protein
VSSITGLYASYALMLRDTPNWYAFTVVAATVLLRAFDTFETPTFFLASDFSSRTSDGVHNRRTTFLVLANFESFFSFVALIECLAHNSVLTTPQSRQGIILSPALRSIAEEIGVSIQTATTRVREIFSEERPGIVAVPVRKPRDNFYFEII